MTHIVPCLWYNGDAEAAMDHYLSVFEGSKKLGESRYGANAPFPKGTLLVGNFELEGRPFMVLNGNADFRFNESISLAVHLQTQAEVDALWEKLLSGGGQESQCGWLKDKFGVSWQVVPVPMVALINDSDPVKAGRVMQAMMKMKKLDLQVLRDAHRGP